MILLLVATTIMVFLRATQQQNVIHGYYKWAAITSYALAIMEVSVIYTVASVGYSSILWVGTGGAIGVTLSMYIHRKYITKG